MDFDDPRNDSPQTARPFPNVRIDGHRPNLWLLIPNVIILGVLGLELRNGVETMVLALMGLIVAFSGIVLSKFFWPPQLSIRDGQFNYRYGFRSFRFPAADLADVHLQNRYVLLALSDVERVEPISMRERMRHTFQYRGFHFFLPPGVCDLDQVNELRAALGMPAQWNDPAGEQIDQFQQSILSNRPIVTQIIIAACIVVFFCKAYFEWSLMGGSSASNIAWGANYGPLTFGGQWWRLITHMFLHGGLIHLGMNMYVFWDVGRLMERLVGRTALVLIYMISGMAGGLASAGLHPEVISIGASGAVFGVIGALFGLLLHDRQSVPPTRLKELRSAILIFIVLNFAFGLSMKGIDVMAHGGGAVAGLIAGLIIVPAEARGHWLRCAILALVGAGGIAIALRTIPKPFDFQAFARRHDQLVRQFSVLRSEAQQGTLSNSDFADKISTQILEPWQQLENEVPQRHFGPLDAKQRSEFVHAMRLRQESFEDWIAGVREEDLDRLKSAMSKSEEADKIEHDTVGEEDER